MSRIRIPGTVVLFNFIPPYASTVLEHVAAFRRHSSFATVLVNTALGFPSALSRLRFDAILLHYSLFGSVPYALPAAFRDWLEGQQQAYRVVFFQDEYRFWRERAAFVDELAPDRLYTLIEPRFWPDTYGRCRHVPALVHTLPGYVSEELRSGSRRFLRDGVDRRIDVGYRARSLPFSLGRAGLEKQMIGLEFASRAATSGLRLDIQVDGGSRLYGDAWWAFLGDCRAVLGVEGGASAFDLDGSLLDAERRLRQRNPSATFASFVDEAGEALDRVDYRMPYLMVTPRHLEAAAFGCVQVLFEGRYSDVLRRGEHYVPLRKDFSNFDEVVATLRDWSTCAAVAGAARRDLVDSGEYDYSRLVSGFDGALLAAGLRARPLSSGERDALRRVERGQSVRAVLLAARRRVDSTKRGARAFAKTGIQLLRPAASLR